jgi:hypothetical protein
MDRARLETYEDDRHASVGEDSPAAFSATT